MQKVFCLLGIACALLCAPAAHADTIFSLNNSACSSGCSVLPAGTVTLHQDGLNSVIVTVQLTTDYSFRNAPDTNHQGFAFNLFGVTGVTLASLSDGPTSQTFSLSGPGHYKDAGLGYFNYALNCTTCAKGATSTPTQKLTFDLTGKGLTTSSFISNELNYFGVDVVGLDKAAGIGLTGNIGAPGPGDPTGSPVPEPSSIYLMGTGVAGIVGAYRRRRSM